MSDPTPKLQTIPFSTTTSTTPTAIHIFSNLLTPSECTSITSSHLELVPSNVTPDTVRTRQLFEDGKLAEQVWGRIKDFFMRHEEEGEESKDMGRVVDEDGEVWEVKGLNEVWRLCLYEKGGKFSPHQDGRRLESVDVQSFMTLNIYLSSVPAEDGGATRFFESSPYENLGLASAYDHRPVLGSAAMFRDDIWHEGEELRQGKKYLLRTDVMFKRREPFDFDAFYGSLGKVERGKRALRIAESLEDAGSTSEAVKWYKKAFQLWPEVEGGP